MSAGHILLIEHAAALARTYGAYLMEAGYQVTIAQSVKQAEQRAKGPRIGLILLDPDGINLNLTLPDYIAGLPDKPVILVTERAAMTMIIESMKAGAKDVFIKPFDRKRLIESIDHFYRADEIDGGINTPPNKPVFIGSSQAADNLCQRFKTIAQSNAPAFITGESGTGKEVSAKMIHYLGSRCHQPFVPVNCAAIPDNLIESELFGHTKGAFTGAVRDRQGAIRRADGGILFLDEVLDMPLMAQAKLLRFLESQALRPVGSDDEIQVDVRIISASNKQPRQEITAGQFRDDLFYRLHVIPVHLPPLRNRPGDLLELAQHFLSRLSSTEDRDPPHLSPEAIDKLCRYPWPGNIRELKNTLHHVLSLIQGDIITADILGGAMGSHAIKPNHAQGNMQSLASIERHAIERAIDRCDGSIRQAAALLDISPSTIYRKKGSW